MANHVLKLENLTEDEQIAVTQLKSRMSGRMDPNMFEDISVFVRFLRARDLNVNAAEIMLRNHIEWRKTNQMDTILTNYTPKKVCEKFMAFSTLGIDKEGSPLLYLDLGNMDFRGMLKSCRKADIIKYIVLMFERNIVLMEKESQKRGKHISQWPVIVNCENFSFAAATHKQSIELFINLALTYDANYPERLKISYFVNASTYFSMFFSVIKSVISGPTLKKLHSYGKDGWKDEILKIVDIDTLPTFLGGNYKDFDENPFCEYNVYFGKAIPESYFITQKPETLVNTPGTEKLIITRRSKSKLTFNVTEPGSYIEWEFETKSRDIGFSLLYKNDDTETQTKNLIPKQRIETHLCSETGMFKCEAPGIYIIEFDNMHSWMYQKEIYYRVSIVTSLT